MPAQIISGTETARAIRIELADEVARLKQEHNLVPGLVTILVGEDPASQSYVAAKNSTAHALGIHSEQVTLPADTAEAELLARIDGYNHDPAIHGILVQLPLPRHINEAKVLFAIDPAKDVDGFHPVNVGKMLLGEPASCPAPRTASSNCCSGPGCRPTAPRWWWSAARTSSANRWPT